MIKSDRLELVPIGLDEKEAFWEMVMTSDGAKYWYDDEERRTRSKEAFFEDWHDGYFDEAKVNKGQCYWIVVTGKKIGAINYNKIEKRNKNTDVDILIADGADMNQGYGPEAIRALLNYLFEELDLHKVYIGARVNNPRAVRAYEKVGFVKEGLLREEAYFDGVFEDEVVMGMLRSDFHT